MPTDNYDMVKRERKGQFELIFPFSPKSEQLAIELNKFAGCKSHMGTSGPMKLLVDEVKQYTEARMKKF